jgi:hypothetical protein
MKYPFCNFNGGSQVHSPPFATVSVPGLSLNYLMITLPSICYAWLIATNLDKKNGMPLKVSTRNTFLGLTVGSELRSEELSWFHNS